MTTISIRDISTFSLKKQKSIYEEESYLREPQEH